MGKERGNCLSFSTPSYKPWIGFLKIGLKSISLVKLIHFLNHIKRFLSVKEMRIFGWQGTWPFRIDPRRPTYKRINSFYHITFRVLSVN